MQKLNWAFERIEDQQRWWVREQLYCIQPKTPLSVDVFCDVWQEAVLSISKEMSFPDSRGFSVRSLNGFTYLSPIKVTDPDEIENRLSTFQGVVSRLIENFDVDILNYHAQQDREIAYWQEIDLKQPNLMTLLEHWRRALQTNDLFFKLHFLIVFPRHVIAGMVSHDAEDLAGLTDPKEIAALTQAHGETRQIALDKAAWALAASAIDLGLKDQFLNQPPGDLFGELKKSDSGEKWLSELDTFLNTYGCRQTIPMELMDPTWKEDPVHVLGLVAAYVEQGGAFDFEQISATKTAERKAALKAALGKIDDAEARERFRSLVEAAIKFQAAMEDDNYYLLWAAAQIRFVAEEIGRRLAGAGVLSAKDDVYFLTRREVEAALIDLASGIYDMSHYKTQADERRKTWRAQFGIEPPAYLGDLPDELDDYILNRFWGIRGRRQLESEDDQVTGIGASEGVVEGVARQIRGFVDFARVNARDIIVCKSTSPSWTPLFSKIAAVVTDQGGMLSHAAIVAREFGVPAVLGTAHATRLIPDGALVRVDGARGTVDIVG